MAFIRNKIFSTLIATSLLCAASTAFAESVAVKDGQIFIADKGLVVKNLLTGLPNQCIASPVLDTANKDVTGLLATATDVVIEQNYAVVTVHSQDDQGNPLTADTVTVDVSNCLTQKTIPVTECISTVDLEKGVLIIPCVKINDSIVIVNMDRRGNSSNWEVTFFQNNSNMANYSGDSDEEDDGDSVSKKKNP